MPLGQAFLEAYRVRDIEEARRREGHPGIVFRDGTAGRRAALAGDGPEVWEIVRTLKGTELTSDEQAIAAAAEWGDLSHAQVQTAVGYYTKFREEVDEMIAFNRKASSSPAQTSKTGKMGQSQPNGQIPAVAVQNEAHKADLRPSARPPQPIPHAETRLLTSGETLQPFQDS